VLYGVWAAVALALLLVSIKLVRVLTRPETVVAGPK